MASWRPTRPKEVLKSHFTGGLFKGDQPFDTFVRSDENRNWVLQHVAGLCQNVRQAHALEVGPGTRPVLTRLPFRRVVLLEKSPQLAEKLSGASRDGTEVIAGDIHDVDPRGHGLFDVGFLCEVLTHVRPSERLAFVERLSDLTQGMVLVDRTKPRRRETLVRTLKQRARHNRAVLRRLGNRVQMAYFRRGLLEEERRSPHYVAPLMKTLVDFDAIAKALRKKGWMVQMKGRHYNEEHYTLLKARRPDPA